MKRCKFLASSLLVMAMLVSAFPGCSNSSSGGSRSGTASIASAASAESVGGGSSSGVSPVYTMTDRLALDGLYPPVQASRANLKKALPTTKKQNLVIGWAEGQMGSPFFVQMMSGANNEAKKFGYKIEMENADNNIQTQSANMDTFISKKVDAIVINPLVAASSIADVKHAVNAGIPVVSCGLGFAADVPVVTSILANNYKAGWQTGIYTADQFKDKDVKAGAIFGKLGNAISESRIDGLIGGFTYERFKLMGQPFKTKEDAMLKAYDVYNNFRKNGKVDFAEAKLTIEGYGQGTWTTDGGLKAAQDIFTAHPNINLIFSENDEMGEGVITAAQQHGLVCGKDVQIVCAADGSKATMDLVKSGKLLCTGYNSPDLNGAMCIDLLHEIFEEGYDASDMPAVTDLPMGVINKETVEKYYDPNMLFSKLIPFTFQTIAQLNKANSANS